MTAVDEEPPRRRKLRPLMRWFPDSVQPPDVAQTDVPASEDLLDALGSKEDRRRRIAGFFRLWLGLAQMAGATIAILLLWNTGLSAATITVTILTTILTVVSLLSYRRRPKSTHD